MIMVTDCYMISNWTVPCGPAPDFRKSAAEKCGRYRKHCSLKVLSLIHRFVLNFKTAEVLLLLDFTMKSVLRNCHLLYNYLTQNLQQPNQQAETPQNHVTAAESCTLLGPERLVQSLHCLSYRSAPIALYLIIFK